MEALQEAVKTSSSIAQVLGQLGLKPAGGNYQTIRTVIEQNKIDITHFVGQSWSKGKILPPKRPIFEYLSNEQAISSHNLKRRLLKEGFFEYKCYGCENKEWCGQPIALELEHIDGNHLNNELKNLTLLCPNCHAQTETYRGKNIGRYAPMVE